MKSNVRPPWRGVFVHSVYCKTRENSFCETRGIADLGKTEKCLERNCTHSHSSTTDTRRGKNGGKRKKNNRRHVDLTSGYTTYIKKPISLVIRRSYLVSDIFGELLWKLRSHGTRETRGFEDVFAGRARYEETATTTTTAGARSTPAPRCSLQSSAAVAASVAVLAQRFIGRTNDFYLEEKNDGENKNKKKSNPAYGTRVGTIMREKNNNNKYIMLLSSSFHGATVLPFSGVITRTARRVETCRTNKIRAGCNDDDDDVQSTIYTVVTTRRRLLSSLYDTGRLCETDCSCARRRRRTKTTTATATAAAVAAAATTTTCTR